jgi:hypothetical protein
VPPLETEGKVEAATLLFRIKLRLIAQNPDGEPLLRPVATYCT